VAGPVYGALAGRRVALAGAEPGDIAPAGGAPAGEAPARGVSERRASDPSPAGFTGFDTALASSSVGGLYSASKSNVNRLEALTASTF
jgi:hypothetical protein